MGNKNGFNNMDSLYNTKSKGSFCQSEGFPETGRYSAVFHCKWRLLHPRVALTLISGVEFGQGACNFYVIYGADDMRMDLTDQR
jgi:hypothetical protein